MAVSRQIKEPWGPSKSIRQIAGRVWEEYRYTSIPDCRSWQPAKLDNAPHGRQALHFQQSTRQSTLAIRPTIISTIIFKKAIFFRTIFFKTIFSTISQETHWE